MEVNQILNSTFDDLVFENKNKAYGAYEIRKKYNKHLSTGLAIAVGILVLILLWPFIEKLFEKKEAVNTEDVLTTVNKLAAPPPLDKPPPPPPEIKIPPPPKTIEFVAPVLKKNVVETKVIPKIDSVMKAPVAATTTIAPAAPPAIAAPAPPPVTPPAEIVDFVNVQQQPEFPGGDAAFYKYLADHIQYPHLASENNIQGTVYVQFVVDRDGSIIKVQLLKGIGGGCDEEAVKVISNMPKWKPGKQNGNPIQVRHRLPVKFILR